MNRFLVVPECRDSSGGLVTDCPYIMHEPFFVPARDLTEACAAALRCVFPAPVADWEREEDRGQGHKLMVYEVADQRDAELTKFVSEHAEAQRAGRRSTQEREERATYEKLKAKFEGGAK